MCTNASRYLSVFFTVTALFSDLLCQSANSEVDGSAPPFWGLWIGTAGGAHVHWRTSRRGIAPVSIVPAGRAGEKAP